MPTTHPRSRSTAGTRIMRSTVTRSNCRTSRRSMTAARPPLTHFEVYNGERRRYVDDDAFTDRRATTTTSSCQGGRRRQESPPRRSSGSEIRYDQPRPRGGRLPSLRCRSPPSVRTRMRQDLSVPPTQRSRRPGCRSADREPCSASAPETIASSYEHVFEVNSIAIEADTYIDSITSHAMRSHEFDLTQLEPGQTLRVPVRRGENGPWTDMRGSSSLAVSRMRRSMSSAMSR